MITLSKDRAIELMDEVVNEYGKDFFYQRIGSVSCVYVRGGKPDCLIAKILARAGVPVHAMDPYEGHICSTMAGKFPAHGGLEPSVGDSRPRLFTADDEVVFALVAAQRKQDNGQTWGEARTAFRAELDLVWT